MRPRWVPKQVGLAFVSPDHDEPGRVNCTCGWYYRHGRRKVREDAADRHIQKKHRGRGVIL